LNKTAIYRGVYPVEFNSKDSSNDNLAEDVLKTVINNSNLAVDDKVIFTHGDLMETVGASNTVKVLTVKKSHF